MVESLVMFGSGGHAGVVVDTLRASGIRLDGFLGPGQPAGDGMRGVPWLGPDEWLEGRSADDVLLVNGLGAGPGIGRRAEVHDAWRSRGFRFASVIHPSAVLGGGTKISDGAQVLAGAVVQCHAIVGASVILNTGARVDHDVILADHAFVGPGAVLCGGVVVERAAFIGAGAVVLPGVTVGHSAVIGAGAVVTRSVEPHAVVVGCPARGIATRRTVDEGTHRERPR